MIVASGIKLALSTKKAELNAPPPPIKVIFAACVPDLYALMIYRTTINGSRHLVRLNGQEAK